LVATLIDNLDFFATFMPTRLAMTAAVIAFPLRNTRTWDPSPEPEGESTVGDVVVGSVDVVVDVVEAEPTYTRGFGAE
jgi:hypothetical protein